MIKRQGREPDPSFSSNAEFMNEWGYASTHRTSLFLLFYFPTLSCTSVVEMGAKPKKCSYFLIWFWHYSKRHRSLSMRNFGTKRRIKKKKARKYNPFENSFQIIVIEFYFTDERSLECWTESSMSDYHTDKNLRMINKKIIGMYVQGSGSVQIGILIPEIAWKKWEKLDSRS